MLCYCYSWRRKYWIVNVEAGQTNIQICHWNCHFKITSLSPLHITAFIILLDSWCTNQFRQITFIASWWWWSWWWCNGRDTCGGQFNVSAHYFYGLTVTFHGGVTRSANMIHIHRLIFGEGMMVMVMVINW